MLRFLAILCVLGVLAGGGVLLVLDRLRDSGRAVPALPAPDVSKVREAVGGEGPTVQAARCPAGLSGCVTVTGRVVLVESVDPDGDGDLHVVLAGRGSVTGPGVSAVDIRPGLRPKQDPRLGDRISAAGQVQRGTYGQSQIHAVDVRYER